MVYFKNGRYHISEWLVSYKDEHEGDITKPVGQEGKEWWEEFAKLWPDTFELKGFEEIKPSKEQLERLEEVNALDLPEGTSFLDTYVAKGEFEESYENPENGETIVHKVGPGHPLYPLMVDKTNKLDHTSIVAGQASDTMEVMAIVGETSKNAAEGIAETTMEMYMTISALQTEINQIKEELDTLKGGEK